MFLFPFYKNDEKYLRIIFVILSAYLWTNLHKYSQTDMKYNCVTEVNYGILGITNEVCVIRVRLQGH